MEYIRTYARDRHNLKITAAITTFCAPNYHINMDFVLRQRAEATGQSYDLFSSLDYVNAPENSKKIKFLDWRERLLLFYSLLPDTHDQDDILAFMKVKYPPERFD